MNINFNLKDYEAEKSAVRLVITHRGHVYRKYTGLSVDTSRWKRPKKGRQWPTDPADAAKLKTILLGLEERLNEFSTEDDIKTAIDAVLSANLDNYTAIKEKSPARPSFWAYFEEWADRPKSTRRGDLNFKRRIAEFMGMGDDWEDIDSAWYFRLTQKMNEAGYSVNYKASITARLKALMAEGVKLKYHTNMAYLNFKKVEEPADSIYLTQDEIDAIWNLHLDSSMERKARDLFILGVYTASRFSDYSRLSLEDVRDGKIRFVQKKTAGSVVIPAAPRVTEVLKRNGGKAPEICMMVYNRTIKEVCRKAGIDTPVTITKSKGTAHITMKRKKYELVSSHTARRTGATLLYMSGVPLRQCMLITGHTTEVSFMKYIRVTKEQNAELLSSNSFFNRREPAAGEKAVKMSMTVTERTAGRIREQAEKLGITPGKALDILIDAFYEMAEHDGE